MKYNYYRLISISALLCLLSATALGVTTYKEVKALLNPSLKVTLDQTPILEGKSTLNYNGKNYVAISDVAQALNLNIAYQNGTVELTTPLVANQEVLSKAQVLDVNLDTVTVLPQGAPNFIENTIILHTNASTKIGPVSLVSSVADLKVGDIIDVTHSPAMTLSIPPQTSALSITVVSQANCVKPGATVILNDMVIVDKMETYVELLPKGAGEDDMINRVIVKFPPSTLNQVNVGDTISARVSNTTTKSIPPQRTGYEITVIN